MQENFPGERVTLYYDHAKDFEPVVTHVHHFFKGKSEFAELAGRIAQVAPLTEQDSIALQPADLIAF
jgi:hypothetical protein